MGPCRGDRSASTAHRSRRLLSSSPVDLAVIVGRDIQLFAFTGPILEIEGLAQVLAVAVWFGSGCRKPHPASHRPWQSSGPVRWRASNEESPSHLPASECSACPRVKACKASNEDVVACSSGVANFCTEPIDSPSFCRRSDAALSSDFRTCSLLSASTCARPSESPVLRVHRIQINDVMAAQSRDRAGQHGLHAFPQADLARHIAGHALVGRPAHET